MSRPLKVLLTTGAAIGLAVATAACGTQRVSVPRSDGPLYQGAVLFHERCAGCHTLSYAATHGSAAFVRTAQFNNGPNFNVRCERTANGLGVDRVLYAIKNGGFSGAIMPQNIVVGKQAIEVARFVATYAGRQAPKVPGIVPCSKLPVGNVTTSTTSTTSTTGTTSKTSSSSSKSVRRSKAAHQVGAKKAAP